MTTPLHNDLQGTAYDCCSAQLNPTKNMIKQVILISFVLINFKVFASENIKIITLESKALNETRKVMVRLPKDYANDNSKRYPVLVTLNDKENFHWANNIVDVQSSRFGIEDMIVVGLPHTGNYSQDNFPYIDNKSEDLNPQAQGYSKFLREEALTYIEENYRTNGGRFIVGHSLSGLFVLKLFMQHPKSFSSYIVLSPSAQYAPQMPSELINFLAEHKELTNQLFLSIGELEHSLIQKGFDNISQVFEKKAPNNLSWKLSCLDNTDHLLSAYKGTYDGLAWIYKDLYINGSKMREYDLEQYIEHYQLLSGKLNYNVKPRGKYFIGFSFFAETKLNDLDAAIKAVKAGIHFHPDSIELKERLIELNESKD